MHHLLETAGNPALMTTELKTTLAEPAVATVKDAQTGWSEAPPVSATGGAYCILVYSAGTSSGLPCSTI